MNRLEGVVTKLLCATDGSLASVKAIAFAVEISKAMQLPLTFFSVFPPEGGNHTDLAYWGAIVVDLQDIKPESVLGRAVKRASDTGYYHVRCVKAFGKHIAQAISDYARVNQYDLIVVGTVGRSGASRLLLGSVASDLVNRAHCGVCVIR
ncbi:MAG TPA: universal stress protein [Burkholderiales bacterium]|nr:universal stress protein [Burkholderiales bacterium]